MNDTANIFFELYSWDSQIPTAGFADDSNIAAHSHYAKADAFRRAWVVFLHFKHIADFYLLYFCHCEILPLKWYVYSISHFYLIVQLFFRKTLDFSRWKSICKIKFIFPLIFNLLCAKMILAK